MTANSESGIMSLWPQQTLIRRVNGTDYERAFRIYKDWAEGRTNADVLRDRHGQLRTGRSGSQSRTTVSVSLSELLGMSKSIRWIGIEGEACVAESPK